MNPGDTIKASKIVISGQEIDNANTLEDDRQLKTIPGERAKSVYHDTTRDTDPDLSDMEDDKDGVIDSV